MCRDTCSGKLGKAMSLGVSYLLGKAMTVIPPLQLKLSVSQCLRTEAVVVTLNGTGLQQQYFKDIMNA